MSDKIALTGCDCSAVWEFTSQSMAEAAELLRSGAIRTDVMVGVVFDTENIDEAMTLLARTDPAATPCESASHLPCNERSAPSDAKHLQRRMTDEALRSTARRVRAFTGGIILTMDDAAPRVDVVLVNGERILAAGGVDLLDRPDADDVEVVDLAGGVLVPGLIDAHNHLSISALYPQWHDVRGVVDPDALVAAIRAQAAAWPDTAWVRCQGIDLIGAGARITRRDLDAAGIDRPVIVADYTLHQCVVSSAGLDALGIGRDTPDPLAGEILRDGTGEPTGLLVERAWSEAHARSMRDFTNPGLWAEHIAQRARALLTEGITCVHDAACSPDAEALYASMARTNTLPIDVVGMPHPAALLDNEHAARLDGPSTGEGDDRFRVGAVKLFADGGVGIAIDASVGGMAFRVGTAFGDLEEHAVRAADHGFRVAIHAMGNVGVQAMIDTASQIARRNPGSDHRFRVEHAGVTSPAQWSALADLGAIAVVQPGFVHHVVGESASHLRFDDHHWLAFAGLAEAGVRLAGSSDDPCAPSAPLWGADVGVLRRTESGKEFQPEQSVPFGDWLVAYTSGAAFAGGQEDERGSITPGKLADLVVLDRGDTGARVLQTWKRGELVHSNEAAPAPAQRGPRSTVPAQRSNASPSRA